MNSQPSVVSSPPPTDATAPVPDPAARRQSHDTDDETTPVRDPAAPPPPASATDRAASAAGDVEETAMLAEPHTPAERKTSVTSHSDGAPSVVSQSEVTDGGSSIAEDTGGRATSLDGYQSTETRMPVPSVSVDGPASTPGSPVPEMTDDPIEMTIRSAPPAAAERTEPSANRASSAMGSVIMPPPLPAASPGFRPYSETPVYSDSGAAPSPSPTDLLPPPPPDQPCSGDWHQKTVDDLIAMNVPDVRIPRCVNTWGACEIRGWLRGLGLEQYVEVMTNNGMCGRRLCLLTASNLPRMGITDWEHIRTITASVRRLLSIDDYVPYERQLDRPPPGPMTRALYLQSAWPTGPPPPSSARYTQFLRQHGFLDVLAELTNRPVVTVPQPQPEALYREIAVPPVPSLAEVSAP